MARLTADMKTLIVSELACFRTPSEVVARVKEEFGVDVDRRHIPLFDPTRRGAKPAERWRLLHESVRAEFLNANTTRAIVHRNFRLRELEEFYFKARKDRNVVLATRLLEQAARECGDAYSNRHVVTPADPIAHVAQLLGVEREAIADALAPGGEPSEPRREPIPRDALPATPDSIDGS